MRSKRLRVAGAASVAAFAALAAGCGSSPQLPRSEGAHEAAAPASIGAQRKTSAPPPRASVPAGEAGAPPRCLTGTKALGSRKLAYGALVRKSAVAYRRIGGAVIGRFGRLDQNDFPTVFGVVGVHVGASCEPDWYHVQLSVLPNSTTGWVRAAAVRTFTVSSRIVVDLSERRLSLYREGKLVLRLEVAVGSSETPTPLGRFFVNERFVLTDPGGPFGPAALGVSAHSEVLHDWVQNGPIGIHGTNEPWSIGEAATHGCIRLPNDQMQRLFELAPAATPVEIRA